MSNDSYFSKKLEPIKVTKQKPISQLLKEMGKTAYQGRKLGEAVDVWENMINSKDTVIAMGFAGSMSTAGQWTIVNWLMENRFIDVLVSTGANVSEDIVDAMGLGYYQGNHMVNDEQLLHDDVNRYYDVYGKETDYREMEEPCHRLRHDLQTRLQLHFSRIPLPTRQISWARKKFPPSLRLQQPTAYQSSAQPWLTAHTAKPSC